MNNIDLFEVTRAEYAGFVETLKPEVRRVVSDERQSDIYNKTTGKHFCRRAMGEDGYEHYYIFELADDTEANPPKAKLQLELKSRAEVQAFFNAVSQLQKENKI